MATCKICCELVSMNEVVCDGICGGVFHSTCMRRGTRASSSSITTCLECAEIKPCHVMRYLTKIFEDLSNVQSTVIDRTNALSTNTIHLQQTSDDVHALSGKIDILLDRTDSLNSHMSALLNKAHDITSKISLLSSSVDDLHVATTGNELISPNNNNCSAQSAIEDIRSAVRQVRNDVGAWTSTVTSNAELLRGVAREVADLASASSCRQLSAPALADPTDHQPSPIVAPAAQRSSRGLPGAPKRRHKRNHRGPSETVPVAHTSFTAVQSNVNTELLADESSHASPSIGSASSDVIVDDPQASNGSTQEILSGTLALRPAIRPYCVFISRLYHETTEQDVANYISARCGITQEAVYCKRIDRHRGNANSFSASFKVLVPEASSRDVISPDIWPDRAIVREFVPNRRSRASTSSQKNSSVRCRSTMQM